MYGGIVPVVLRAAHMEGSAAVLSGIHTLCLQAHGPPQQTHNQRNPHARPLCGRTRRGIELETDVDDEVFFPNEFINE
jgi:hypothetical protein